MFEENKWPRISIVIPTLNQGDYIEETILSILNQNYPNLEIIVIDGGSTDRTSDIIEKYKHKLTYSVSEKDLGQADAINKGLKVATGRIFNWINSDDVLAEGALFDIALNFDLAKFDMYAAGISTFSDRGVLETVFNKNLNLSQILSLFRKNVEFRQPAIWLKRENIIDLGGFSTSMHYAFDFEFILRYLYHHQRVRYGCTVLVYFRHHPASKSIRDAHKFKQEKFLAYKKLHDYIPIGKKHKFWAKRKLDSENWIQTTVEYFESATSPAHRKILYLSLEIVKRPLVAFNKVSFSLFRKNVLNLFFNSSIS